MTANRGVNKRKGWSPPWRKPPLQRSRRPPTIFTGGGSTSRMASLASTCKVCGNQEFMNWLSDGDFITNEEHRVFLQPPKHFAFFLAPSPRARGTYARRHLPTGGGGFAFWAAGGRRRHGGLRRRRALSFCFERPGGRLRLYFARHGESLANTTRTFSNRDAWHPLTERGQQQAAELATTMATEGPSHIFCSPAVRAQQTAAIVGTFFGIEPRWLRRCESSTLASGREPTRRRADGVGAGRRAMAFSAMDVRVSDGESSPTSLRGCAPGSKPCEPSGVLTTES